MVILATFLPWGTASAGFVSETAYGFDTGIDGWFIAGAALVAVVTFALNNKTLYIVTLTLAVLAAALAVYDVFDVSSVASNDVGVTSTVGVGLWLATIGTIAYLILALICQSGLSETATAAPSGWSPSSGPAQGFPAQSGRVPPAQIPQGQTTEGQMPQGQFQPWQTPPAQMPPGHMPSGQMPPPQT